jgi:multidrug efflux pump subunit AcrA (membrane-fusion protein)
MRPATPLQEAATQEAAAQEAARQETARQEAARETARAEAEREEAARRAAAELEAQRQEAARREAARAEADREEAARQAAARQEASRAATEQEQEANREARLRAIGRQLDEEAARREAASIGSRSPRELPLSLSSVRRVRLWGRSHANVELVQYAEAWALKIQFDTPVETVREVARRPHTAPMVTVAIRSDGSVESVTFDVSSGVAEIDEAIRRIVEARRPYSAFPPALAREFDVIEVRRTWHFDSAIRLY